MTWFTGSTFTMFFYAMNASFLAVAAWPKRPLEVFYDGDCGFCERTRRAMERADPGRVYAWEKLQTGRARSQYGISDDALMERLHVVIDGGEIRSGFAAFKRMLLANPLSYFFFAAAVLASGWVSRRLSQPRDRRPRRPVLPAVLARGGSCVCLGCPQPPSDDGRRELQDGLRTRHAAWPSRAATFSMARYSRGKIAVLTLFRQVFKYKTSC